jgi:RNA polymerase sigma-70 factor (ECF subfamily)
MVYNNGKMELKFRIMDKLVQQINKIILKISKGDINALDDLFSLTSRMLLFMAKKYLNDKSFAEDIVSEVYLIVARKASTFDKNKNGLNWLYKITRNTALNFNAKRRFGSNIEYNDDIKIIDNVDIDDWLDKILIHNALSVLSQEEKRLIYLRYWEGLTIKEISEQLNQPMSTVYDAMKRVLKKLKKLIAPKKQK